VEHLPKGIEGLLGELNPPGSVVVAPEIGDLLHMARVDRPPDGDDLPRVVECHRLVPVHVLSCPKFMS
jgi:hypothetical protein